MLMYSVSVLFRLLFPWDFFQALIRIHNYKLQPSVVYQIIKLHILLNKISVYFDEFCCNFCNWMKSKKVYKKLRSNNNNT